MKDAWCDNLFKLMFGVLGWFCAFISIYFVWLLFANINNLGKEIGGLSWIVYTGFGMIGFMIFVGVNEITEAIYKKS